MSPKYWINIRVNIIHVCIETNKAVLSRGYHLNVINTLAPGQNGRHFADDIF